MTRPMSGRLPGWLATLLALVVIGVGVVIGLLVVVPLALIAAGVFAALLIAAWIRAKFNAARAPNGPLDGRQHVRVIRHDHEP